MTKTLRQLTREKFQEEVARELGIDLSDADQVRPTAPIQVERETDLDSADEK